ncbi:MAG: dihydroxyacetone kinase subunit L [Holophaga sp.]|jgi:dihydroxyacetone kinase-like protein
MADLLCLRATFKHLAGVMARNKDHLIELDQQNGDGDLGLSMADGYRGVSEYLDGCEEADLGKVLMKCSGAFNQAAPSTLGTISAFFLMGMAKALKGRTEADLPALAAAMEAGLALVMEKTCSKPGEKTIVDALAPAIEALKAHASEPPAAAFERAAEAAEAGSEATRAMRAVHGRAAYYGDRSVGVLDGGSAVGALVFRGIADHLGGA